MLGFNHTLAGCIAAVIVPAPVAPLVAFASHFIFDMTPHFGRHPRVYPYTNAFKLLLVADGVLCSASLVFAVWLFPHLWWLMILCAAASTLPDFMWLLMGKVKQLEKFLHFATVIQWWERPYGWIFDLMYGMVFVWLLIFLA